MRFVISLFFSLIHPLLLYSYGLFDFFARPLAYFLHSFTTLEYTVSFYFFFFGIAVISHASLTNRVQGIDANKFSIFEHTPAVRDSSRNP